MTKENQNLITVPSDFKEACSNCKITMQFALQIFIDCCTLFHALKPGYSCLFSEALETIFRYLDTKRPGTNVITDNSKETQDHLLAILKIVVEKRAYETLAKKEVAKHVDGLLKSTAGRYYPSSRKLFLDAETPLKLTKDFCAMCQLYECYPAEILNYYMGMISLADVEFRGDVNIIKAENHSMFFFMNTMHNFVQRRRELLKLTAEEAE